MTPLYSLCTPSHAVLRDRFFLPTFPDDLRLCLHFFDNPGAGFIHDPSFCRAIIRKVQVILTAIEENWGRVFIWCDVDAQFFRPFGERIPELIRDWDIAFQVDAPGPALCDGLFICRANDKTLSLWRDTLAFVLRPESRGDDQACVRQLLVDPGPVKVGFLPPTFMGGGTLTGRLWRPGESLPVTEGLVVHHANFTCGVPNKAAQCEQVRGSVERGDLLSFAEACARTGVPWLWLSPRG